MEEKTLKHKSEFYTCKRWRMLEWLMNKGFKPEQTLPDPSNPSFNVWKLKNSVELEDAITEYFKALNNK